MTVIPEDINPEGVELAPVKLALNPIINLSEGGYFTLTALDLGGSELEYDSYEALGAALGTFDRACRFWIGDWLIYGERTYDSDRYAQAATHTGLSERTLENRAWLCRAIPPNRRRPLVPYSCHVLVAPLTAREQRRWLKWAEDHQATVAELRAAMKEAGETPPPPVPDGVFGEGVDTGLLVEAAISLVKNAQVAGENVLIRREDYARLLAALGEEEA